MGKSAAEHLFTGLTTPYTNYDSTKTVLGKNIMQINGGSAATKYAGPAPLTLARPFEQSVAIAGVYPFAIQINNRYNWVFLVDNGTAAVTRRVMKYTHDKQENTLDWNGFVTLTFPITGNQTAKAMRVIRELYSTGTVAVSGTAVTGTTTTWVTQKIAAGARIGFGSTDPSAITTWYSIASIDSNTGITLNNDAGTISSGAAYVIEELRILLATTNATAANGGLYLAKGINNDDFTPAGTTIAAAASTDNVKAVYWLADAATVLNTIASGIGLAEPIDVGTHYAYVLNADTTTSARIYKYNIRASLGSISSGKTTSAFVLKTGGQTVTGTISQTNNCRLAAPNHGPGDGVNSLYFTTTSRIYRCLEAAIVDASITFVSDAMVEIPTGSINTIPASNLMSSIEYTSILDRFIITTGTNCRMYFTQYNTISSPFEVSFGSNDYQIDQSSSSPEGTPHMNTTTAHSVWVEDGIGYFARNGTSITNSFLYTLPVSAHWDIATDDRSRLITPSIDTSQATRLYRVYVNEKPILGERSLGVGPEPYALYVRTSGINDNSGSWSEVLTGNLTGIAATDEIQFMFEFRVLGTSCVPAQIHGITVVYEDSNTDSHYQPSVAHSSIIDKQFAWRFATEFGDTVPDLRVRLYDATSFGLLVDDDTDDSSGTFEQSVDDGDNWSAWDGTDKANETTYIRYTPASLGDNIKVRALLTQL